MLACCARHRNQRSHALADACKLLSRCASQFTRKPTLIMTWKCAIFFFAVLHMAARISTTSNQSMWQDGFTGFGNGVADGIVGAVGG